jgi:hypothetical protein
MAQQETANQHTARIYGMTLGVGKHFTGDTRGWHIGPVALAYAKSTTCHLNQSVALSQHSVAKPKWICYC